MRSKRGQSQLCALRIDSEGLETPCPGLSVPDRLFSSSHVACKPSASYLSCDCGDQLHPEAQVKLMSQMCLESKAQVPASEVGMKILVKLAGVRDSKGVYTRFLSPSPRLLASGRSIVLLCIHFPLRF